MDLHLHLSLRRAGWIALGPSSSIASAHDLMKYLHALGIPACRYFIRSCTEAVFQLHPAGGGFSGPFAVISSQLQPPPRRERALSFFQGSMDQLSSSEGLAPRRWPIHRARLAASASSLLQASEDRTPFHTGKTATYYQLAKMLVCSNRFELFKPVNGD